MMETALLQDALHPRPADPAIGRRQGRRPWWLPFVVACVAFALGPGRAAGDQDWRSSPPFDEVDRRFEAWLSVSAAAPEHAVADWRSAVERSPRAARLGVAIRNLAASADERLGSPPSDQPPAWLDELGDAAPSLRLAFAEQLALQDRPDACLAWLGGLDAETVYAPALLHYLRTVAHRRLVDDRAAQQSLAELEKLLVVGGEERLGRARRWVVQQLGRDLAEEPDPLSSIARRMTDTERRLASTDPGESTQRGQQTILDEIDKLIESLEKQRQQQQQAAADGANGGAESGPPAEDSRPGELKGAGQVDRKRLVAGDAWGALPPAERERLTQSITRDYPPHYRLLVEDYFRTLAAEADRASPSEDSDR